MATQGPSLRELQESMMHAILEGGEVAELSPPRVGIYINHAWQSFLASLETVYPVTCRLVGAAYFAQCVRVFRQEHPSRSGDLQAAGAGFASTLRTLHRGSRFAYLSDIAHFEWLHEEALLAAEHAPFDLARLAEVDPNDYGRLRFKLHPSSRLFESRFPCSRIWRANRDLQEPPLIDLHGGAERCCLKRSGAAVELLDLSAPELAFLRAIRAGAPFAVCLARGTVAGNFNVQAALQRFVTSGTLVDFSFPST